MKANETSGQESDGRTDLSITVCDNGVVNIHRPESDRAHSVILDVRGDVAHCSCKGYKFRSECSHADAIESRPLVVSSALAAAASHHDPTDTVATNGADAARAVADGGRVESAESGENASDGETCDDCGLSLAEAQEQPAGYTRLTTDGEKLCGACSDIRHGWDRRSRKTADELAADGGQESGGEERETVDVHGCSTCSGYAYGDDDQCAECQQRGRSPVNETAL